MDNEVYASYLIPTARVAGLDKTITRLANRVKKGKTDADFAPSLIILKEIVMVSDGDGAKPFNTSTEYSRKAKYSYYTWVTLHYQRPIINGWQLVAVYDWETTDDGIRTCYVSPVPGMMVPLEYRDVESGECDHCHANRRRNKSMLVTKNFLEFKVVGSTCVKDFLGHKNPKVLMDMYSFELSIKLYAEEEHFPLVDFADALLPVSTVLKLSAMMVRLFGYVKTSDYDNIPTAGRVSTYMNPISDKEQKFVRNNIPTQTDIDMGAKAAEWVLEQSDSGDYMSTLIKCVKAGAISHKRLGFLASAITAYKRATEKLVEVTTNMTNEWVGEKKERLRGIVATIKMVRTIPSNFDDGATIIVTLVTGEGNTFVWFATNYPDAEVGDVWTFDGTVKNHNEYRGTRQTVISRVKYTSMAAPEEQAA